MTTSYAYNGLGARVKKTDGTTTVYFAYDESGHLVGKYDGAGGLIQETVWFGEVPVATLRPDGSGGVEVYYVHADHLNTPRKITRPSDGVIVWRWDSEPYGATPAEEDPDGDGDSFTYHLRFPGQYLDQETGLHYNYFRDYDPVSGRYVESDPIGIEAGLNTFEYVGGNPVLFSDPTGLIVWSGDFVLRSASLGGGGVLGHFELVSECVDGVRQRVRVGVAGFALDIGFPLSEISGTIAFEDGYTKRQGIRVRNLKGAFELIAIGPTIGPFGVDPSVSIGIASAFDVSAKGLDLSAISYARGFATLDRVGPTEDCGCAG